MQWQSVLGIVAVVLAAVALVVALVVLAHQRRGAASRDTPPEPEPTVHRELIAFVANPSKPGVAEFEAVARRECAEAALPEPLWIETTVEDPGVGQARQALEKGADVVVAVGGDGTVRAVAEALTGTGKVMGLVPSGTGNLLARNLDVPVSDHLAALRAVVAGQDRTIDVGWTRILELAGQDGDDGDGDDGDGDGEDRDGEDRDGEDRAAGAGEDGEPSPQRLRDSAKPLRPVDPEQHIFLVIAGLGFDAAMVADADDQLKARVGWIAYFVAGIKHLHGKRMRANVTIDDRDPVDARLRTVLIGNCGRLPGGINLLPDAVIDDGILDVAAIDTRGGMAGWVQLFGEVVMQGFGVRNDLPAKIGRIDHTRARRILVRVEGGEQAQVDGDTLGLAVELEAWVEPAALVVRTS
ncbi:diacylglycerol kinase family protein [Cellulomonas sp. PhB143]|uniref:diacylglycerol/lipid kinase family protein n=1 Tax=Cellulomonas sp. PhB143 TaxID=2485186 RepID=UPI000F487E30|nr:diacylglycerol kinase family protein [Cellulomonas sp. PhB143]ROS79190.1 diacylglycerol kinase family enzyme [Cellulomonas sp. PhB143]